MTISFEMEGDVGVVTMDDGKANAASAVTIDELAAVLDRAVQDSGAVVLSGRPGIFSAGFDMKTMKGDDAAARKEMITKGARMAHRLFTFPKPLVIAATGHAFALGTVWLLCADTRIGESGDYKFGLNETAIGEILPAFGYEPALMRLNRDEIMPALVQAKIYDPQGALAAGYLDQLVASGEAKNAAISFATELAKLPGGAYLGNKMAIRGAAAERMAAAIGTVS